MPGRCAGCGKTGSASKISRHIADCARWAELFGTSPDAALDAETEYQRWLEHDKEDERDQRRETHVLAVRQRREEGHERWRSRDILADDEEEDKTWPPDLRL
jgi:hypothetical protein